MAGSSTPATGRPGGASKLQIALIAGGFCGLAAYFRHSLAAPQFSGGPDRDFSTAVVAGLLAFGVVLLFLMVTQRRGDFEARQNLDATFALIAGRLQGRLVPALWPRPPRIHFVASGRSATLEYCSDSYDGTTRVTVDLRGVSPGTLMIFRDSLSSIIPKLFGAQDLQIGDPQFDDRFILRANPPSIVRRMFSDGRRVQAMESVLRIEDLPGAAIHLTRESLTVRTTGYLRQESELWALARTALDVAQFILELTPPLDVTWGEPSNVGGQCPICGSPLVDRVVRCARCQTPHHGECWKYNGRCSLFACGETRSTGQS